MSYQIRLQLVVAIALLSNLFSCKKFVEIGPPKNQVLSSNAFASDDAALSAMSGVYSGLSGSQSQSFASGGLSSVTYLTALSADELISYSANNEFYRNGLSPSNGTLAGALWNDPYRYIYTLNLILEGLDKYSGVTAPVKKQLQGEAKFVRAFIYFYLLQLFGNIPLQLGTDYKVNAIARAATPETVYAQLVADLTDAQNLLSEEYPVTAAERIRPNKWAAAALLARVYLYMGEWSKAESMATTVIGSGKYQLNTDPNAVFLKNSSESIWQLKPVDPAYNTNEGRYFRLLGSPVATGAAALNPALVNSFELADKRRKNWVDSITVSAQKFYFPAKYKITGGNKEPLTEYSMVLRLAELYLIRAEARAKLTILSGARDDLNEIRKRAGLKEILSDDQTVVLNAIDSENRHEFFMEWGHRWLDLKRLNLAGQVLGPVKVPDWQSTDVLYPIPLTELSANPNLKQNAGY